MRFDSTRDSQVRTLASSLTACISSDIVEGRLKPGAKLRIRELAERYGAGQIPLREALSRLVTSGFVTAEDQKGFRVSTVSDDDLQDITETRVFVECEALRRSILAGQLDWEQNLVSINFRLTRLEMMSAGSGTLDSDWERAHENFHTALLSSCGSKWLLALAETLRLQTTRYRHLSVRARRTPQEPVRDVPSEHRALFDSALRRDADAACAQLERHIRATAALAMTSQPP